MPVCLPSKISETLSRALAVGLILGFGATAALAQTSKADVCAAVAKKAQRVLWDEFREAADESFCRKPWVDRGPHEFLACAGANKALKMSKKLRDRWNRFFQAADAEWATWGPRGIAEDWETGTIRGGFKRTFFGPALAMSTSTTEIEKRGGRAEAFITVCELDQDGNVVASHRRTFPKGKSIPSPRKIAIRNGEETRILGVVIDTRAGTKSFEYSARLTNEPIRNDLEPVKGLADLHVHQFANLAFGGRLYWGQHDGPAKTALAPEVLNPKLSADLGDIKITLNGLDANAAMKLAKPDADDEGFVQLGGEGHPSYKDWPHHADRSHQQVYIDWLHEAVKRNRRQGQNLGLMVLSIVHNDILCKAFKAIDPRGNVPTWDSKGNIVGWESAPWGCEDDESVKRQLEAAQALERKYAWYRIAMNPWHARRIVDDGDLAVVVSIETDKPLSDASGKYGNWEDKLDFYRSQGVTTLQVVHESNSRFCGAALHREMMQALQFLHWPMKSISNLLKDGQAFDLDAKGRNRLGITLDGRKLIDALVARHMPIDLAHGSVRCRRDIMAQVPEDYGLYDSHTKFERLLKPSPGQLFHGRHVLEREKTFMVLEELEQEYLDNKVLIGLRTASVDVYDPPNGGAVANDCPGSAKSFAQMVQYAHEKGFSFTYGTDFNTGVSQLGPRFGPGRCYAASPKINKAFRTTRKVGEEPDRPARAARVKPIAGTNYYDDGLATIGWLPELTRDLIALGTPGAKKLTNGAENFILMWERAYDHGPARRQTDTAGGGTASGGTAGCKKDGDCDTGEFCSTAVLSQNVCLPLSSTSLGRKCTSDRMCTSGRCSAVDGLGGTCVCASDRDCGNSKYCDKGWLTVGKNQCVAFKAYGTACSRDDQCKSPSICKGKPVGKCITEAAVGLGGSCIKDVECKTGSCNKDGNCQCKDSADCGGGKYCDTGTAGIGKNICKAHKKKGDTCSADRQCGPRLDCKGVIGFKKCT